MIYRSFKNLITVCGLTLALTSTFAIPLTHAQTRTTGHEGWYQVELIVFARTNNTSQVHWPSNIKLRYPTDWVELKAIDNEEGNSIDLTKEAFYRLPDAERQLNAQAQKLKRSSRFKVLFHDAWRQTITNEKAARHLGSIKN